jgi:iron complex transport system substrate-binding protein
MIMRVLSRRLPALAAAKVLTSTVLASTVLAAACAGCGSSQATAASPASTASGGSAAAGSFPATVKAANGTVRLSSRPAAIISLSPTATEMLYAIGAGSQVKAVDSDSDYPPGAPRTKLSAFSPNVEAIVGYKPDLIIVTTDSAGLVKQFAAFKIPVLELPAAAKLSDVYAQFGELGRATGHVAQAAQEDASLRAQLARIVAAAPRHSAPLTYYYELDQTYYSVTSATFIGQLLSLLGLKSIADQAKGAAAAGGYPQLSAEYIIKTNPDYIILADTICCHQSAATVAKRPGWSTLAAVKAGHVVALSDDIASRWGPRITDLLGTVETAIAKGAAQ